MADITRTWRSTSTVSDFQKWGNNWLPAGTYTMVKTASASCNRHRKLVKNPPPTHMSITRFEANASSYSSSVRRGRAAYVFPGPSRTRHVTSSTGSQSSVAVLDAQARLARGSLNLAQTIAESREAYGTIWTNLYRLGTFALALKRGHIKKAASVLDIQISRRGRARLRQQTQTERLANGWLEFQYGIMPIIGDVNGAIEHLDTSFHKGATRTSRGGLTKGMMDALVDLNDVANWSSQNSTIEVPPRVTLRGEIDNPELRRAQELGLLNPLALAWELVPFSFILDWFMTIGAWFDSLTHGAGLSVVWGCTTSYSSIVSYQPGGGWNTHTESIVRTPNLPVVSLPFLMRTLSLRGSQITTLAAVTRQRLR